MIQNFIMQNDLEILITTFFIKCIFFVVRPWINWTTWLNYILIRSCKITFLIYKVSFWKFRKLNKIIQSTPVNFYLENFLKNIRKLININSTKCRHRQPVRDQHWQTSAEHRYHARHMPALRPHLPVRAQYRARCKFLIG